VYFLRHFLKFRQNNQKIPFLQTPKNKIFEKQPKNSLSTNSKKKISDKITKKFPFYNSKKENFKKSRITHFSTNLYLPIRTKNPSSQQKSAFNRCLPIEQKIHCQRKTLSTAKFRVLSFASLLLMFVYSCFFDWQ
jgi:hypothetical protein